MLWFQKDSLDTVGLRAFRGGGSKTKLWILVGQSDIWIPKCIEGGVSPIYQIFWWLPLLREATKKW